MRSVIDLTDNSETPVIKIWGSEGLCHTPVRILEGPNMLHERHFGVYLREKLREGPSLEVCSVEHAEAIIKALQIAIDRQMVLPKELIDKHHTRATTTRKDLEYNIKHNIVIAEDIAF